MLPWILAACLVACLVLVGLVVRGRWELRASREAFAVLSQQAPVGILTADAAGQCVYANEQWCDLSGLSLEETLGRSWSQAVHPEDIARVMAKWAESVAAGDHYLNKLRLLRPDGTIRHVLASARAIRDAAGHITGFIGTVLDVTRLERADREIARREQLLRSLLDLQEREKRLLCHEFHDGLIQYTVGSKMLLEGLRQGEAPQACDAEIDSVIDCLAKGIEDGRRVIRGIRPAALDDLGLRAAIDDLVGELRESGIAVESSLDPDIDLLPQALQTTVYRVVQESLTNVRKHAGSDRVRLTVERRADRIEVAAEDFGRCFDASARAGEGFGLLGIRERVRLAGGECRIESEAGGGTRVRVWLPLEPEPAAVTG